MVDRLVSGECLRDSHPGYCLNDFVLHRPNGVVADTSGV